MKIDIWSDIVCPFCSIGKRHLEQALDGFAHRDDVEIVWHSFELDPTIEAVPSTTLVDAIAAKYGMTREQSEANQVQVAERAAAVGLDFNWRDAKFGNTFDAHRLLHLAAAHGIQGEATERLMRAYFTEGVAVGDHAELCRLGLELGLPEGELDALLAGDDYADAVRADEAQARAYGITGVPFFVLDDTYAISGAQPVEVFTQALDQAWRAKNPLQMVTSASGAVSCEGDSCAI